MIDPNPFKDNMTGRLFLGRYKTVRKLAAGGMGVVYLARFEGASGFSKPVVLKLMLPGLSMDKSFLTMFVREAKILSRLDHPSIVRVLDFAKDGEFYIMALEYVSGYQLNEWLAYRKHINKPLSLNVILQLIINILDPLYYAHNLHNPDGTQTCVIHRDISPANVMINTSGNIKLVDFGIAKINSMTEDDKTHTGTFKGKLSYSAPERFGTANELTSSCDLYSVGVMLHEMLIGKNDFYTGDQAGTISRVLNYKPRSVLPYWPQANPILDKIVLKALAKTPEKRFKSTLAFSSTLKQLITEDERVVNDQIREMVAEDFTDAMASFLHTEPLSARDSAWRNPSTIPKSIEVTEHIPLPGSENLKSSQEKTIKTSLGSENTTVNNLKINSTTMAEMLSDVTVTEQLEKKIKKPIIIGAALALILLTVQAVIYLFFAKQNSNAKQKQIVVIQSPYNSESSNISDSEYPEKKINTKNKNDAPVKEDAAVAAVKEKPVLKADKKNRPKKKKNPLTLLTRSFRKHAGRIKNCIDKNVSDFSHINIIKIQFSVSESGTVTAASLKPASISNKNAGKCILSIARKTTFPKLDKPITFQIPIRVSK